MFKGRFKIFKINRKLEYGLIALSHMVVKPEGELTTAKEICQTYQAPFDATAKVLQQLAHAGWLNVVQGAKGGYQITDDIADKSFLDLAEILVGPVNLVSCLLDGDSDCGLLDSCNVVSPMAKLNNRVREFYQDITLKDLLAKEHVSLPQDIVV